MNRDTNDLIRDLAAQSTAVRPLRAPWQRAVVWCVASVAYLSVIYWLWPHAGFDVPHDRGFVVEQTAALATALAAAIAAFSTTLPGRSRTLALVPLVPLAVWIGEVGRTCVRDWSASHVVPPLLMHSACFPITVIAGLVPAAAIVVMLRRGAPMTPRITTALAALAVTGIADFGIRFVHAFDPGFVVLAWHLVAVLALSAILTAFGERVFSWRKNPKATTTSAA